MREDVSLLYEVQKLDQEIVSLREQIKLYGPQLKQIEARHNRKKQEMQGIESREGELKKKLKDCETSIKDKKEDITKCLSKQSQVKTNQEFQALTKEIANLEKEISSLEEQIFSINDEIEKAKSEISKEKKEYNEEEEEIKEEKDRITRRINEKKERLNLCKKDRPGLVAKVESKLYEFYERIGRNYPAQVITFVKNKSCQGCYSQLLPQELINLHIQEKIIYCRSCKRILAGDLDEKDKKTE